MDYEIIYSDRRTLALTVRDGRVIVRSPRRLNKKLIDAFVQKHEKWIEKRLAISAAPPDPIAEYSKEEIENLSEKARKLLTDKTEHYSEIMGLKYGRITITGAKTRFGSCSSKGNISYSYRLLLYPDAAIDYVVVHELSHLLRMNHSREFYKIIERVLPDYRERIKLLKRRYQ